MSEPYYRIIGLTVIQLRGANVKKMTVLLEDELYTAAKVEAARLNRTLREVVAEALNGWLELQEDLEVAPLIEEAMAEYREKGGIEAGEFFRQLEAERKSA